MVNENLFNVRALIEDAKRKGDYIRAGYLEEQLKDLESEKTETNNNNTKKL